MLIQQQSLCWQQFLAAAALRQNPMQTLILANQEMTKRKIVERNLFGNRAETSNFGNSFNARNTLTNNIPPSNRISKNIVHNNSNPRETSNIYLSGNPAKTLTQIQSKRQNK
uniref:Uncharacterized protein n=1 Tax=Meloidogyne hapla TaxID=6305 RepID=A0A1I8C1K4_MELHA